MAPLVDGPKLGTQPVTLIHQDFEPTDFGAPPYWKFDSRVSQDLSEEVQEARSSRRSPVTQVIALTIDPNPSAQLTAISAGNLSNITYYGSQADAEADRESSYPISIYDNMTQAQARAHESGKIYADLYSDGMALAVADTSRIDEIQALLDGLGDGARVMNVELADCPSPTKMLIVLAVPLGLELWYSRRLQTSGFVDAAFPDVQPRDPTFSAPFIFAAAALKPALQSAPTNKQKYQAVWNVFEQRLKQFAITRRRESGPSGVVRHGGMPDNMYRAELTGRPLAVCSGNRWEKIIVQAAVNGFDAANGRVTLSVNFSDGYFGTGSKMPSDERFRDNEISDTELGKLQAIFLGATENGAALGTNIRCSK